jgi:hypothetical protein
MPPGQTIVLLTPCARALFGWWRPDPASGIKAMNNRDGWTCTIFRNEGAGLSSQLVLDAECAWAACGYDIGPDGFLTYVWDAKVATTRQHFRKTKPGYCFIKAGWKVIGRSADGHKTLLQKKVTQ